MVDKKVVKSAGEHWVCSVLARFNWAAALTRDGVERTDILAVHPEGGQISIQVKTISPSPKPRFPLGEKGCLPSVSESEWYVLVLLSELEWSSPRSFVIPRNHVAAATWIEHTEWLTNPTQPVGRRNTPISGARIRCDVFGRYEERWDLLKIPTSEVPILLPPKFRQLAQDERVGLRLDHPWSGMLPPWDLSEDCSSWTEWMRSLD